MPINIPDALPAKDILESEKIFAIEDKSAHRQRIRPLKIVILSDTAPAPWQPLQCR